MLCMSFTKALFLPLSTGESALTSAAGVLERDDGEEGENWRSNKLFINVQNHGLCDHISTSHFLPFQNLQINAIRNARFKEDTSTI